MNKSSEFQKSEESFNEECVGCNAPMSTETLSEEEFDEHPERVIGYAQTGDWICSDCRVQCAECSEPAMADTHPTKKSEAICDECWDSVDPPQEEVCSDCDRGFGQLDANDVEMLGEGKYARCADCDNERFSHMEDACEECGDRVGRHAANVGTLGMAICFDCDSHGAMIENE